MVSGNPGEIRGVAAKARNAHQVLDADLRAVESMYNALKFDVPNKTKVTDLLRDARAKLNAAREQLVEFDRRLTSVAQQLENINRG